MGIIALEVVSDFRLCEGLRMPAPSRWRRANRAGWREAAQGEPWREVAQDLPWRAVAQVGPLVQVARPFCAPGQTPRCSPRSWRRQEGILQSDRQAEA